ncbi:hypothetical protein BCR33DRAFT_714216 [Rhizoclosmatium globosum]|uniref:G-protein coupled receptors family 1 profile domain-containing protein n=1 Tax=Rhizoclosmatium globosum TaxID=329046 RepID=A0A1Y2CQG8_9FUNG|nr:hypothetical protein BCR33DRAFT_714216 [Rhizoclosmatium globosum]|eukprot:ORY49186.1 hypothetical protein BCR33DRAFT_714216 [Rhizoclosmatium globosum]
MANTTATGDGPLGTTVIFCLMIPLNMIVLAILLNLILEYDVRQIGKRLSIKLLLSPMNRILILGVFCLIPFNICMVIQRFRDASTIEAKVSFVLEKLFLAIVELCGICYSWIRGEAVVNIVCPRFYNALKYSVMIFPAFFFLQVISTIAYVTYSVDSPGSIAILYAVEGSVILAGLIVCFFDAVFTVIFSKYIHQHKQLTKQDKKLYTISKYSVIATETSFSAVLMYAAGFAFNSGALFDFSPNFISFTFWVLVRMKYMLYKVVDGARSRISSLQKRKTSVAVTEETSERSASVQSGSTIENQANILVLPDYKGGSLPRNVRSSIQNNR